MFKRFATLAALGILCVGCGTVPVPRQIQSSFPIDQPFERVWQSVIEVFAELSLPIMNMEKASGLITTDWISFRGQKNEGGYCDCGKTRFPLSETDRQGKFNVYVKRTGETCELKVNSVFEKVAAYQEVVERTGCISTGNLEAEIFKRVQAKIK